MSSLKTESAISQFPPTFLPYSQKTVQVPGHEQKLPLFLTKAPQGSARDGAGAAHRHHGHHGRPGRPAANPGQHQ
jgi:hypothetical protein